MKKFLPIFLILSILALVYGAKQYQYPENPPLNSEIENIYLETGNIWKTTAKARAYLGTDQSIPSDTLTLVELDTESYDPGNNFNTTLHRFIVPVSGYYQINVNMRWASGSIGEYMKLYLYKNESIQAYALRNNVDVYTKSQKLTDTVYLAKDDYVEIKVKQAGGAHSIIGGSYDTYMAIHLLSKD